MAGVPQPERAFDDYVRWEEHHRQGHKVKDKTCPVCQAADGPVVRHERHFEIPEFGVLFADMAGPYPVHGPHGDQFLLVMGARLKNPAGQLKMIPCFVPLPSKSGPLVQRAMLAFIAELASHKWLRGYEGRNIHRVMTDQGKEFVNRALEDALMELGIHFAHSPAEQWHL